MNYILSVKNTPFSDWDAARAKADTMSEELGVEYQVIRHPEGGWAVAKPGSIANNAEPEEFDSESMTPSKSLNSMAAHNQVINYDNDQVSFVEKSGSNGDHHPQQPGAMPQGAVSGKAEIPDLMPHIKVTGNESPKADQQPEAEKKHWLKAFIDLYRKTPDAKNKQTQTNGEAKTGTPQAIPLSKRKVIKLRPAIRSFWNLQLLLCLAVLITVYPKEFLLQVFTAGDLQTRNGFLGMLAIQAMGGVVIAITTAKMVYVYLANRYRITDELVESQYGIIARRSATISIDDIRAIDVNQGIIDRILDVGTLELSTAGTAGVDCKLLSVARPMKYKEEIARRRDQAENNAA